jgi:transcriptional regulator with XRE-family HTH domain
MGTRERPADRGRRRAQDAFVRLAIEFRQARIAAGLSLRDVAVACSASYPQLWRFERGKLSRVVVADVGAWFAAVSRDLSLRAYPSGDPIRDRAQRAVHGRLRSRIDPSLEWREEVALPIAEDLRAWDAVIRGRAPVPWRARVEAETNAADVQALERRLWLKARDDADGHVILLLSDTRANRETLPSLRQGLKDLLPSGSREVLAALAKGREPPGGGVVIL